MSDVTCPCCSFSEAVSKAASTKSESQEEVLQIFNIDTHTSKQLRHFKFLSVSFMSQLLASNNFIRKVMCSFKCVYDQMILLFLKELSFKLAKIDWQI